MVYSKQITCVFNSSQPLLSHRGPPTVADNQMNQNAYPWYLSRLDQFGSNQGVFIAWVWVAAGMVMTINYGGAVPPLRFPERFEGPDMRTVYGPLIYE